MHKHLIIAAGLVSAVALASVSASAAAPERASCDAWAGKVCDAAGASSEACRRVQAVAPIMPKAACDAAMKDVDGTVKRAAALRKVCDDLATRLCKDLGETTQTCGMVRERTPQFEVAQCQEMADNYALVLEELRDIERQNAPLSAELVAKHSAADAPSFGPKDAKVVLVEYSDFQCPYCAVAAETLKKVKAKYGDKIRVVFRQFPLSFHPNAQIAAEASLEAHAQGKFWAFHDLLFANQDKLDRESLEGFAEQVGMDVSKLKEALDAGTHKARVAADLKLGEEVGVNGTPSMMLGPDRVANPNDFDSLTLMIEAALEAARR